MIRKILNAVLDTTLHQSVHAYQNPFTKTELAHLAWLSNVAPCFPVSAENITILNEPKQFYAELVRGSKEAKKRITLASLYLGNGDLEKGLVDAIMSNENLAHLQVNVLLDYSRGSRSQNNSRKMLQPLLRKGLGCCNVSLYHTPVLRGLYKKLAPNRWNELFGIQHMKLYIFDDTLIISGANLSNDYFTNRQDRYYMIKDKYLCDYYCGLVKRVQGFSLQMDRNDDVKMTDEWIQLPYEGDKAEFVNRAGDLIESYIYDCKDEQNSIKQEGYDTWIFPLTQMGQLGVDHDANATDRIFAEAPEGSSVSIATAYFNLTQSYMRTLVHSSRARCDLLMAHPKANGFLGAKGMAGGIPDGYSLIARRFQSQLRRCGQHERITLSEYRRDGWTYHAKGLWYHSPNDELPCMTLIGSPNFGDRSVLKDLETQVAIVTENDALRRRMRDECRRLYALGSPAALDRPIPAWVYAMVFLFRDYF